MPDSIELINPVFLVAAPAATRVASLLACSAETTPDTSAEVVTLATGGGGDVGTTGLDTGGKPPVLGLGVVKVGGGGGGGVVKIGGGGGGKSLNFGNLESSSAVNT